MKKPFINFLIISGFGLLLALFVLGLFLLSKGSEILPEDETFSCSSDSECILAVDISSCCDCPFIANRDYVKKTKGVIEYHAGMNYIDQLPDHCTFVDCAGCPPVPKDLYCYQNQKCRAASLETGSINARLKKSDDVYQFPIGFSQAKYSYVTYVTFDGRHDFLIILETQEEVNCTEMMVFGELKEVVLGDGSGDTKQDYKGLHLFGEQVTCVEE